MSWEVGFNVDFEAEFDTLDEEVQDEIATLAALLETVGPDLGRPKADTLKGSKHRNMKELRFNTAGGVWRIAYAFDPLRRAVLLVAATSQA